MLLTAQDLADWLGVSADTPRLEESLSAAEAITASYIGARTLEEAEQTELITPPRDRKTLNLRFGPLTTLIEVTRDSIAVNSVESSYWVIGREDGFVAGAKYNVVYRSGWTNDSSGVQVPAAVRNAVLMIAAAIYTRGADGGTKSSERIGDFAATYVTQSGDLFAFITRDTAALLREYRRPAL